VKASPVTNRPKILVTDNLFILDKHVKQLEDAGYDVERLNKAEPTEAELKAAVKGKTGYIMGGIEYVTAPVIEAADQLQAIVFAGSDWRRWIPGHAEALDRGIKLAYSPGGVSESVAEYTLTLMLVMARRLYNMAPIGESSFLTTDSLCDLRVGIIGMGQVPRYLLRMLQGFGIRELRYANRTPYPEIEKQFGVQYADVETVLTNSDIVCFNLSSAAGAGYMDKTKLSLMHDSAVLIDTSYEAALDLDAAYAEVSIGRLRIAWDHVMKDPRFSGLPLENWLSSHHTAYNTHHSVNLTSDMATASLLNLLRTGKDQYEIKG
jgi:lactate dehydrogenase-like 2-hydroxyacid dehydrogenase